MHPLLSEEPISGRSRNSDDITRGQPPPMTYFMADEKTLEYSSSTHSTFIPKARNIVHKSNYGVESIETMTNSLIRDKIDSEEKPRTSKLGRRNVAEPLTGCHEEDNTEETLITSFDPSPDMSRNVSPSRPQNSTSRPFTPLSSQSPNLASSVGSPDSRILSDGGYNTDDIAIQDLILSRGDDQAVGLQLTDSGSAPPQLVMPSIKMPSRRPFTEKGRNLCRLKILIAGDSGVGKTSLVKAIVQTCEDIVHVDSIRVSTPNMRKLNRNYSRRTTSKTLYPDLESTSKVTEIYASTKPYPAWWSETGVNHLNKRRKDMGDIVLERNLCFIDTPGYGNKTSQLECISSVVDYVESQFKKLSALEGPSDPEMINMLSGNGGTQVDVVLYLISNGIKTIDIEYLRRLSKLTNIIPLIAHADKYSDQQISSLKNHIVNELQAVNIKTFSLESSSYISRNLNPIRPSAPFAVSCKKSRDLETMDASFLMSPDYVQPLIESELKSLVTQIFERDTISWLRFTAAKKFILWRSSSTLTPMSQSLYQPSTTISAHQTLTAPVGATTSYAMARITDHIQREERIAHVRLANWAAELQRSLQNERSRFENLARNERAIWLTQRLCECVQDGSIVPISQARYDDTKFNSDLHSVVKSDPFIFSRQNFFRKNVDASDPLGLLLIKYEFRRKSWLVIKMVSSLGVISGLAFWGARAWNENWQVCGLGLRDLIGLEVVNC